MEFGHDASMVVIGKRDGQEEISIYSDDGNDKMQEAAYQILHNICDYIYATCEEGAVIDGFHLELRRSGELNVQIISENTEDWTPPAITNTPRQLTDWFDRELEKLAEGLTDRFTAILQAKIAELASKNEGLEITAFASHGVLDFKINLNGNQFNFGQVPVEVIEEHYPGLNDELEELIDAYCSFDHRVTIYDIGRIEPDLREPEPEDDGPEF